MADRGGCEFIVKVRNAQRAGAAAAIIGSGSTPPVRSHTTIVVSLSLSR
jgi:hypothetical protein